MKLSRSDTIVLITSGISITVFSTLLYFSFQVHSNDSGVVLGHVENAYNITRRKSNRSVLWEKLISKASLYELDWIRTDHDSSLSITLQQGARIGLDPDSMVVLSLLESSTPAIELKSGSIEMNHGSSSTPATVKAGQDEIQLQDGTARFTLSENGVNIEARSGHARLRLNDREEEIQPGTTFQISKGKLEKLPLSVVPVTPPDGGKLFYSTGSLSVNFQWFSREKGPFILEISDDSSFQKGIRRVEVNDMEFAIPLSRGYYYWRVKLRDKEEEIPSIRRFSLLPSRAIELFAPVDGETFRYAIRESHIFFSWEDVSAPGYMLRIWKGDTSGKPVQEIPVEINRISVSIPEGDYFWSVEPISSNQGEFQLPGHRRFRVMRKSEITSPFPRYPAHRVLIEQPEENPSVLFTWDMDEELMTSELVVSSDPTFNKIVWQEKLNGNHIILNRFLPPGTYFWKVRAFDENRKATPYSKTALFRIQNQIVKKETPEVPVPSPARTPQEKTQQPAISTKPQELTKAKLLLPVPGSVVDMTTRDTLEFRWSPVPGASEYTFHLFRDNREIFSEKVSRPQYSLTELSLLDTGVFQWKVEAKSNANQKPSESAMGKFTITLKTKLEAPGELKTDSMN